MPNDHTNHAVEEILQHTGQRISQNQLFIESIVYSNTRLKLAITRHEGKYSLVRVPSSYLYAHVGFVFGCIMGIIFLSAEGFAVTKDTIGIFITLTLFIAGGYAFIWYVNESASKRDPLLTYDSATQRLHLKSLKRIIRKSDLCCILALASINPRSNKPEKSYSELKLISLHGGRAESCILAKTTVSHLPHYDDEAKQLAQILNLPYLHVDRTFHTGQFSVERIN